MQLVVQEKIVPITELFFVKTFAATFTPFNDPNSKG